MRIRKANTQTMYTMQDIKGQLFLFMRNICAKNYRYENLPEEIDEYILEDILFLRGQAVWFKIGNTNFVLPSTNAYNLNVYGKPMKVSPIAFNGATFPTVYIENEYNTKTGEIKHEKNAVLIMNNNQRISTYAFITPILDRLTFLWENLGLNACYQRCKALIEGNSNVAKDLKNSFYEIFGNNKPFVVVKDPTETLNAITPFEFNIQNDEKQIWEDFDRTFNLLLTFCGINNNSNDMKKERLIIDEVNANNEIIDMSYEVGYDFRKKAIDQINKMFGLNIKIINKIEEKKKHQEEKEKKEEEKEKQEN